MIIVAGVGFLSGITTVVFGFGGGFIAVPFVYHFILYTANLSPTESMIIAVATSTAVMIVNTGYASYKSHHGQLIKKEIIFPLVIFIGLGAIFGAYTSTLLHGDKLRYVFFAYILFTIIDCVFRPGFITEATDAKKLKVKESATLGPIIDYIAAMLGVGGSVMTVPLLRRKGYDMNVCVSSANPLAMPVAIVGTIMYAILGHSQSFGADYVGYVNIHIFLALTVFGFLGIVASKKYLPKIKDSVHAKAYICLLSIVLISMMV
nr:sulfite exporter TauE/SafE family protein [Vibrio sinus]